MSTGQDTVSSCYILSQPPDILLAIVSLLSHEDVLTFSLVSQATRAVALLFLFKHICWRHNSNIHDTQMLRDFSTLSKNFKHAARSVAARSILIPESTQHSILHLAQTLGSNEVPEAHQNVRSWRHRVQKAFLGQINPGEDFLAIDHIFALAETLEMTTACLSYSKIGKVMRHVAKLPSSKVPRDDEFKFRSRALALHNKWHQILSNGHTAGGIVDEQPSNDRSSMTDATSMTGSSDAVSHNTRDDALLVPQALATLHCLHSLHLSFCIWDQTAAVTGTLKQVPLTDLSPAIEAARQSHSPIRKLTVECGSVGLSVAGPPVAGLTNLEELSIHWSVCDELDNPGSAMLQLLELIRPSLSTLVVLHLQIPINSHSSADLDLSMLEGAGLTLREFRYHTLSSDGDVLEVVSRTFPHLRKLSITWDDSLYSWPIWTEAHLAALGSLSALTDLYLSVDFEEPGSVVPGDLGDPLDYSLWIASCFERRLSAARSIARVCSDLCQCNWRLMRMRYGHADSVLLCIVSASGVARAEGVWWDRSFWS